MYKKKYNENIKKRGYRQETIDRSIRGIKFRDRQKTLTNKSHDADKHLTFTTTYSPHLPTHRLNTGTSSRNPHYFPDTFQVDLQ